MVMLAKNVKRNYYHKFVPSIYVVKPRKKKREKLDERQEIYSPTPIHIANFKMAEQYYYSPDLGFTACCLFVMCALQLKKRASNFFK
jgi:hypothetical protein